RVALEGDELRIFEAVVRPERARVDGADASAEIERLSKEVERAEKMLANKRFVANAPAEVVEAEREKLARYRSELEALTRQGAGFARCCANPSLAPTHPRGGTTVAAAGSCSCSGFVPISPAGRDAHGCSGRDGSRLGRRLDRVAEPVARGRLRARADARAARAVGAS